MIRVRNLRYAYAGADRPALRGLDFGVADGEVFGFLGPSDAGKSTTQKVLVGSVLVGALGGPTLAFAFGTLASNSIEGLALGKLVNLVVLGPAVVVAAVPEPLQFAAAISPIYWPVKAVVAGVAGEPLWASFLLGGLAVYLLGVAALGRRFASRAD